MRNADFDQFTALLDGAYDLIGSGVNKTISAGAKSLFFSAMAAYSLDQVRSALSAHCLDRVRGRFTPKPADLIEQIEGAAADDGRPGSDEAWAVALTSRDEADTVVWTTETAEAFAICSAVLAMGDEVGARMAFKSAYDRIVNKARGDHQATKWVASLGFDADRRVAVLQNASRAGLLSAPTIELLLPPPMPEKFDDEAAREQIDRIKQMMATMGVERQRQGELHAQRDRDETAAAKAEANSLTANYKPRDAA